MKPSEGGAGGRRGRRVPEGMGLPAGRDPGGLSRGWESDLWERRHGGTLRARGEAGTEERPAGQCCGGLGSGWRERRVWPRGGGCGTAGGCGRSAGSQGGSARRAERGGGHGVRIRSQGSCVAAAGERSAVSHRQMNGEERRELGGESPRGLQGRGKPLRGIEEEEKGGR